MPHTARRESRRRHGRVALESQPACYPQPDALLEDGRPRRVRRCGGHGRHRRLARRRRFRLRQHSDDDAVAPRPHRPGNDGRSLLSSATRARPGRPTACRAGDQHRRQRSVDANRSDRPKSSRDRRRRRFLEALRRRRAGPGGPVGRDRGGARPRPRRWDRRCRHPHRSARTVGARRHVPRAPQPDGRNRTTPRGDRGGAGREERRHFRSRFRHGRATQHLCIAQVALHTAPAAGQRQHAADRCGRGWRCASRGGGHTGRLRSHARRERGAGHGLASEPVAVAHAAAGRGGSCHDGRRAGIHQPRRDDHERRQGKHRLCRDRRGEDAQALRVPPQPPRRDRARRDRVERVGGERPRCEGRRCRRRVDLRDRARRNVLDRVAPAHRGPDRRAVRFRHGRRPRPRLRRHHERREGLGLGPAVPLRRQACDDTGRGILGSLWGDAKGLRVARTDARDMARPRLARLGHVGPVPS